MKFIQPLRKLAGFRGIFQAAIIWIIIFSYAPEQAVMAQASAACPAGKRCVYLPGIFSSRQPEGDLLIHAIEVTQAVQDDRNSVPLVAGRTTILRVYAQATGMPQPVANVQVRVSASRGGAALAGSPRILSATIPLSYDRANFNSSINLSLPSAWLQGNVDLQVHIDADDKIFETNEGNNTFSQRLAFTQVPPLNVKIVPILYTHVPNGRTYAAPNQDSISNWIYRTYPIPRIDITWRTPYAFTGDLTKTDDWQRLLSDIQKLRQNEGAPSSQVYYGLVPAADSAHTWFYGGVAGIGYVGLRASVGMDSSSSAGQIAAHEIGHNLGMGHTPCGNPAGIDASFPYTNGSIGQFGLDVTNMQIYTPSSKDVMSYCNPKWISDYTYKALYRAQALYGSAVAFSLAAPAPAVDRVMHLRAVLSGVGAEDAVLLPAYVLPGSREVETGPGSYQVELLDAQEAVLGRFPVQAYEIGDGEGAEINTLVPLAGGPVSRLRLLKDSRILAERTIQAGDPAAGRAVAAQVNPDGSVHLRWDDPDRPALVRYSTDGGGGWTVLGVDVTGGELEVSPVELPAPGGIFEVLVADTWH